MLICLQASRSCIPHELCAQDIHEEFIMKAISHIRGAVVVTALFMVTFFARGSLLQSAQAAEAANSIISLPAPNTQGGMPLMQAMKQRKSERAFSDREVDPGDLSNVLWAAFGANREDGKRTVPTARNKKEALVYVALKSGVWLYDGERNTLEKRLDADLTGKLGAPLVLLYAAKDEPYGGMHVGSMYQNVGLYCASKGMANVVKAQGVAVVAPHQAALGLPDGYVFFIVQAVGYRAG